MKTFLIITNDVKDPHHELTDEIKLYIEKHGCKAIVAGKSVDGNDRAIIPENEQIDFALVLGGDGTILRAARDICGKNIPILGINLGTLGFLSDVEKERFADAVDRLIAGEYFIQDRMMLQGVIETADGKQIGFQPALNDITITRQGSLHVIHIDVYVNGQFLYNIGADGIIAATPTGSTGYSLSAGGPIILPTANLMVMTPICAHSINGKSIVVGPEDTITFVIGQGADGNELYVEANSDGYKASIVKTGDKIIISKAPFTTKLIKLNQKSFLQTLNRKMSGLNL